MQVGPELYFFSPPIKKIKGLAGETILSPLWTQFLIVVYYIFSKRVGKLANNLPQCVVLA